jgi:hypothetical protein
MNDFWHRLFSADTIYTIRKMNDFWHRLFRADTNNINRINTQFSIRPSVVIVAERPVADTIQRTFTLFSWWAGPVGNVLPPA